MIVAEAVRSHQQEQVAAAFDAKASCYDDTWTWSVIGRLQREPVWREIDQRFRTGQRVLDLGCGTGADALHLARLGIRVHAVDISPLMLAAARNRAEAEGLSNMVTFQLCGLEDLAHMTDHTPFDGAISNFGALNCVDDLQSVAVSLAQRLRPGAFLALCYMGRFCLWETLWYLLRGLPGKAFRRLSRIDDLRFTIDDWAQAAQPDIPLVTRHPPLVNGFQVFYPTVAEVVLAFRDNFQLLSSRGIGILVPPSYVERRVRAVSRLFRVLSFLDRFLCGKPILRAMADHRLLIFVRK